MESKTQSPSPDNADAKAAFRKPSNDTANRKYRRRSPVSGSSSSDGSPKRTRGSIPIHQREDPARDFDPRRRKDDGRDFDNYSDRYYHGRSDDSYRHSDRQSSRSHHNHHRHEKHTDEEERNYSKSSSRSGRELGVGTQSGHTRRESEHYRSRDHLHGDDKYSRDRYDDSGNKNRDKQRDTSSLEYQKHKDKDSLSDRAVSGRRHANLKSGDRDRNKGDGDSRDGKRDYQRNLGNYRNDRSPVYEEHMGPRNDSVSRRDNAGHRMKEASKSDPRELDCQKYTKEEKKKYDDRETSGYKDRYDRDPGEQLGQRIVFTSENQESAAKKPKLFTSSSNLGKDVSKFTTVADEKKSSSSKQAHDLTGKVTSELVPAKGYEAANDLDAAMKAAELVNKNLTGMGYMSTDQKKKLLWGNKKSTNAEESGHRWDTALFSDRERQEKFNKLMSLRLPWCLWPIVGCEGRAQAHRQSREQWSPPTRKAEGTTARFGEAIHCWTPSKRRSHRWTRSLRFYSGCFSSCTMIFFSSILMYSFAIISSFVIIASWFLVVIVLCNVLFKILDYDGKRRCIFWHLRWKWCLVLV